MWIGPEFCFGNRRRGDLALLQKMGAALGFTAGEIEAVDLHGERISSTRIRQLLQQGDFARANDLLGRPYAISGRVVRGRQLAVRWVSPLPTCVSRRRRRCRVSTRPGCMVCSTNRGHRCPASARADGGGRGAAAGSPPVRFQGDLYGRHIDVEFVAKLRDEEVQ